VGFVAAGELVTILVGSATSNLLGEFVVPIVVDVPYHPTELVEGGACVAVERDSIPRRKSVQRIPERSFEEQILVHRGRRQVVGHRGEVVQFDVLRVRLRGRNLVAEVGTCIEDRIGRSLRDFDVDGDDAGAGVADGLGDLRRFDEFAVADTAGTPLSVVSPTSTRIGANDTVRTAGRIVPIG